MKKILGMLLLLAIGWNLQAQTPAQLCNTFVKQFDNAGLTEPRIFRDPSGSSLFLTASNRDTAFISGINGLGNIIWTRAIRFPGDQVIIRDMIVDQADGTLVAIVRGIVNNYMFKFDYAANTFSWLKTYPDNYLFENIHQTSTSSYVATGQVLLGPVSIFRIDRSTGNMSGFQRTGVGGEFFSAYDATGIYGACRRYSAAPLFNPSLFRYDPLSGNNTWTKTYIKNSIATDTCRIYPVAPVIDQNSLVQLSSGDDVNFNTYDTGPTGVWLLKTDLNGFLAWTFKINIPGYNQLNAKKIINTATGYYLLIDSYNPTLGYTNYFFVVKTDKNGKVQWANRYGAGGENTAITGVEDNGYLYVSALSGTYSPGNKVLLLKLNSLGMSDPNCGYIKGENAFEATYVNSQLSQITPTNPTTYTNSAGSAPVNNRVAQETIRCSSTCPPPSCTTLSGTLANGVMAFYPFGNGTLNDLSGNNYNLSNPTTAVPVMDRDLNPNCAYHFDKGNNDYLTLLNPSFLNGITMSAFSISMWYQPTTDPTRMIGNYELLMGRGNTGLHCPDTWSQWSVGLFDCRKAVVGFDQYSHWQTSTSTNCPAVMASLTNVWHHLAFVYDPTNASPYRLYVDGILYFNSGGPCGPMSGNIGALLLGRQYTGDLDDIVIYSRAITASEVAVLYGLPASCCDGAGSNAKKASVLPKQNGDIKIYPNPSDGRVNISAGSSMIRTVNVYTNTGYLAGSWPFNATDATIDISSLAPGMYFLKIITDSGSITEKVIKE